MAGLVEGDGYVHAAVRRFVGRGAACGAGRIIQLIAGPFDAADRLACPACAEVIGKQGNAAAG